jgi:small subunit ribosomal protein S21
MAMPGNMDPVPDPVKPWRKTCRRRLARPGTRDIQRAVFVPVPRVRPLDPVTRTRVGKESQLPVQVIVRDNNVDQALRALKKKMQREGIFREMKLRRHFEKPSERKARERAEAVRRMRKVQRKRMEREGY